MTVSADRRVNHRALLPHARAPRPASGKNLKFLVLFSPAQPGPAPVENRKCQIESDLTN